MPLFLQYLFMQVLIRKKDKAMRKECAKYLVLNLKNKSTAALVTFCQKYHLLELHIKKQLCSFPDAMFDIFLNLFKKNWGQKKT